MATFFTWKCPMCGMKNYEIIELTEYLCRAGDCGEIFKPEGIEIDEEPQVIKF